MFLQIYKILTNFDSNSLICDLTLFPGKNSPILIAFFLERGKKIEPWFWHIWISQWLKFFATTPHLFRFRPSSRGNGWLKLDQKRKLWVRLFFMKTRILQIFVKQCFCLLEYHLWWEFWQYYIIFGGVRAQKPPKKGRHKQNFENF